MNSAGAYNVLSVARSGRPLVDGLLYGRQWDKLQITYAFPDEVGDFAHGYIGNYHLGFSPVASMTEDAARSVLSEIASFTKLSFTEGDDDALIRVSMSSYLNWGFPSSGSIVAVSGGVWDKSPWSDRAGDVWISSLADPLWNSTSQSPGNRGYCVLMHEIGHSLGLKHPHDERDGWPLIPPEYHGFAYTVMGYNSAVGSETNFAIDNPQSYMMGDIAALQYLYGANFKAARGDTTYTWAPGNFVWETIWDGGGVDTYDFSNFSGDNYLSLRAGDYSTFTQLARLFSSTYAPGNVANALRFEGSTESLIENIVAGSGDDTIVGNRAANVLTGGAGADTFVFYKMWGADRVTDFADGSDMIQFMWESVTIEDVLSSAIYANGNTKILFGDEKIVLENFDAANLDEADFVFGAAS